MSRVGIVAGAAATRTTLGEPRFPTFFYQTWRTVYLRNKKLVRLEIRAALLGQPGRVTVLAELTFLHLNSYPSGPTRIRTDNQSTSERFSACLSGLLERVTLFPWTTFSKNRRGLTKIWVAMNLTHTFLNLLTF